MRNLVFILTVCVVLPFTFPVSEIFSQTADTLYSNYYDSVEDYIKADWKTTIETASGLPDTFISLAPYWNYMYYWDNYFLIQGLLLHNNVSRYAKNNCDNMLYTVNQSGFMPNCTASWGTDRSEPPYLSMIVRDVYNNMSVKNTSWLKSAYITLKKEFNFWMDSGANPVEHHNSSINGLQHYSQHATPAELVAFYGQIASGLTGPLLFLTAPRRLLRLPCLLKRPQAWILPLVLISIVLITLPWI